MRSKPYKQFLELSKALSDDTRADIVLLLASGEKCVCEIFNHLKLPQNLVSHHLKILRQSKLIVNRKNGKWVRYSLNRETMKKLQEILGEIIAIKKSKSKCNIINN